MRRGIVVAGMLLALGLAGTAEALDSYQSEVSFDLLSIESTASDASVKMVGYRWYFAQVDGMEGPIELQPFRQRASWAEVGIGFGEDNIPAGTDIGGLEIDARYVIPNSAVGVDLNYEKMEINDAKMLSDLRLGAVIWLNDDSNLALEAGIAFGERTWIPSDTTTFDVGARYVMPIQDFSLEIAGRYKSVGVDVAGNDESGIEVETRFFFNDDVFAGVSFSTVDADGADTSNWAISGGYVFPMGLDVGVRIGELLNEDIFELSVGFRF